MKKREIVVLVCLGILWFGILAVIMAFCEIGLPKEQQKEQEEYFDLEDEDIRDYGDLNQETEWNLLLVNGDNPLPEDYEIPEMTDLRNGHGVDSRIYPELQDMMDAARAAGYNPLICSSYRSWDKQQDLYIKKVRSYVAEGHSWENALELAAAWVQKPGYSEHQTGMALDIVDVSYQLLDENQENTPAQQWLMANCAKYGFILRYPKDKTDITGVSYEPWHYRYVGKEAAERIMEEGLCLEEYLWHYKR